MDLEFMNTNDILSCCINDSNHSNLGKDEFEFNSYSATGIELVIYILFTCCCFTVISFFFVPLVEYFQNGYVRLVKN